ncbi:MAG: ABC transporter permease subunit [Nitriliruptorales bacterium]|nr:ABC transporter permease subunit [Nitriliruptorales bacterium]
MKRARVLPLLPAALVVGVLFGGALLGAVRTSLQPGPAGLFGEPSLDAWRAVLSDVAFRDALLFTSAVTVVATVLAAVIAVAFAAALRRHGAALQGLFGLPVLLPHLVIAVVAVIWIGPGGLADRLIGGLPIELIRDRWGIGIIAVYAYKEAPFLALLILAAWDASVTDREEAAAVLGAGRLDRLRHVVWPAIRLPLTVGALIAAAFTFGSFEVPLVVGPTYPPTLAVLALQETQTAAFAGQARASAILLVAAVVTIVLAVAAGRQVRDARR